MNVRRACCGATHAWLGGKKRQETEMNRDTGIDMTCIHKASRFLHPPTCKFLKHRVWVMGWNGAEVWAVRRLEQVSSQHRCAESRLLGTRRSQKHRLRAGLVWVIAATSGFKRNEDKIKWLYTSFTSTTLTTAMFFSSWVSYGISREST